MLWVPMFETLNVASTAGVAASPGSVASVTYEIVTIMVIVTVSVAYSSTC